MGNYPGQQFKKEWMYAPITSEVVEWTESFGKFLCEGKDALTTSQLRKFFGEVKRIQVNLDKKTDECKTRLVMLKPMLAYAVGRAKNGKIEDFQKQVSIAVDAVLMGKDFKSDFKNFANFLESVVAYHKLYGGV